MTDTRPSRQKILKEKGIQGIVKVGMERLRKVASSLTEVQTPIGYSDLDLEDSITDSDVNSSAGIDWSKLAKTASDILGTIASWANVISEFGAWTAGQFTSILTSWATVVTDLGNLAWSQLTKTASDIMTVISSWANILSQVGAMTTAQITTALTNWANIITSLGAWTAGQFTSIMTSWATVVTDLGNLAWSQLTKTASDVMTTISSWANILTQVGGLAAGQITTMLTNWATVVTDLGNLAWNQLTKTASDIMGTISSWANILSEVGAMTTAQITTTLTNWANIITSLGAWSAGQFTSILTSWATVVTDLGNLAWSQLTKTASDVMTTISSWANILSQVGAMTTAQITATITNWANMITALGTATWSLISDTWTNFFNNAISSGLSALTSAGVIATGAIDTLAQMADNFFSGASGRAKFKTDLGLEYTKLEAIPYKLPTSAYNFIVNPDFEYGDWGGDETQSSTEAKFGLYSAKLEATGSNIASGTSNYIDVRGLDELTVAVWIKITEMTTATFYAQLFYYDSDKSGIGTPNHDDIATFNSTQDWTQHSKTYDPSNDFPVGTCFVRLSVSWYNGSDNPDGVAYMDGWQLNLGDQVVAFQDFTTYSYRWMPKEIKTSSTSQYSWSSTSWTDVLTLTWTQEFDCLALIFMYCYFATDAANYGFIRVLLDDTELDSSNGLQLYVAGWTSFGQVPNMHFVQNIDKGSHTLKIQIQSGVADKFVYATERRLTVLTGSRGG